MIEKLKGLVNSLRFWQLTAAMVFLLLGHYLPGMEFLWNTLAGYLAAVVGVGTVDSASTKFGVAIRGTEQ